MLGDEERLAALDQRREPLQMVMLDAVGRAERQADAVQAQRIIATDHAELPERSAAAHVVFRMHLEPADGGAGGNDFGHMRRAQTDADRRRDRTCAV